MVVVPSGDDPLQQGLNTRFPALVIHIHLLSGDDTLQQGLRHNQILCKVLLSCDEPLQNLVQ